jgi:hypothetical protein
MSHFWLLNQQKPSPTISFGKWEHSSLCISLIKGNFSKKDDVLMPENWLRFELGPVLTKFKAKPILGISKASKHHNIS